jgi:hypothetical protein
MTDSTLSAFVWRGTHADRLLLVPSPPSAANGYFAFEIDTGNTYAWNGSAWQQVNIASSAIIAPQGRLTLTSNTPVMNADATAQSSVYYTPYIGNVCPIYSGSAWANQTFAQQTLALDTTNHPIENLFDVYAWMNGGTFSLGTGPAWVNTATVTMTIASPCVVTWTGHGLVEGAPVIFTTSGALPTGITAGTTYYVGRSPGTNTFNLATSAANAAAGTFVNTSGTQSGTQTGTNHTSVRGTGAGTTELQQLNGIWTNKNSITLKNGAGAGTAGIAANTATYLGTIYTTANGQTGVAFNPAPASNGTANIIGVFNAYNRVAAAAMCRDSKTSWTYLTTSTWRASDNSVSNRVTYVDGLAHLGVDATFSDTITTGSSASIDIGLCRDSTNADAVASAAACSTVGTSMSVSGSFAPSLGLHFIQAQEASNDNLAGTFYGLLTSANRQCHCLTVRLPF